MGHLHAAEFAGFIEDEIKGLVGKDTSEEEVVGSCGEIKADTVDVLYGISYSLDQVICGLGETAEKIVTEINTVSS